MTVGQLIERLCSLPADVEVYFDNQEFGPEVLSEVNFKDRFEYPLGGGLGWRVIRNAVWLEFASPSNLLAGEVRND